MMLSTISIHIHRKGRADELSSILFIQEMWSNNVLEQGEANQNVMVCLSFKSDMQVPIVFLYWD